MPKYRKKPVVIEAIQINGQDINCRRHWPLWLKDAYKDGFLYLKRVDSMCECFFIKTLEGEFRVNWTDYIIQGVEGELYNCKADIFHKTYEEVREGGWVTNARNKEC